jgi:hypothetical protein
MKKIYILIFLISTHVLSTQVDLLSLTAETQTTGDLITFKVESELDFTELQKYKNKRVGDILYVLEVNRDGNGVFIRGILAAPEQNSNASEKAVEPKDIFTIKNLSYEPVKSEKLKDFIIFNGPDVKFSENSRKAMMVLFTLLGLMIGTLIIKRIMKIRKLKSEEKERLKKIETEIKSYSCKKDFEQFYLNRKVILRDFEFNNNKLNVFIESLNLIQYKETWSEEELTKIKESYLELIKSMGRSNGI